MNRTRSSLGRGVCLDCRCAIDSRSRRCQECEQARRIKSKAVVSVLTRGGFCWSVWEAR